MCLLLLLLANTYLVESFYGLNFMFLIKSCSKLWPLMKNDPLKSRFHISYQDSEISWWKMPISYFQSHFSRSKISQICPIFFSSKNIKLGDQLLLMKFFEKIIWRILYFLKTCPFFVSWFLRFGKRYESDFKGYLHQWP